MKWSSGWNLEIHIKDKKYTIELIQEGHINFAYFEELCYIKNMKNEMNRILFRRTPPRSFKRQENRR
ncbi:hypothetical protein DWQ65_08895 [Treponema phagedenis]|uniref:Uncharacterized protein n=1 Tax=Treponema phagedenis TaxID=162 RepID=A0A0B7H019_TREPH|nr:hypothetical protein [Treponema phagedenis]QSH95140.1 hypothetical protein C5O78_08845 [Treponema phagedenis]QSI00171.1 hypothetical protein DWQ65_08895 [Treponema phagedenis]CEM62281.1 conserved hypothetical protein [Treponema phagedenis]